MQEKLETTPHVEHDCVVVRLPKLLLEVIGKTNGVAAAVESSRNETVKRQDQFLNMVHQRQIA